LHGRFADVQMRVGYVLLVVFVAAVVAQELADPPRPVLKEQFETQFSVHAVCYNLHNRIIDSS
jgi:hypothetical protein